MAAFSEQSDEFLVAKVRDNFAYLTGEALPTAKGKMKSESEQKGWFHQLSFVHLMIFNLSFVEANRRGLLNAVEVALCEEVLRLAAA